MRRRPLRLLLLVVLGTLLPLVVLEGVLRAFDPFRFGEAEDRERFAQAVLVRDPGGTLRLRAGARASLLGEPVTIGAAGLRTPPFAVPKPAGVFRVLVLGDSVAFGWGIGEADAFPRVLERLWNEAGPPAGASRVEVVNAGVPGWGAPNQLLWLRDEGLALQPDLVLVTLINNDLTDVLQAIAPTEEPAPIQLPAWLRTFHLGRALEHGLSVASGRVARPEFFVALDLAPEPVRRASEALCAAYGEMRGLCGDVPFAVMDTVGDMDGSKQLEPFVACMQRAGLARIDSYLGRPDYREVYSVSGTDDHPNAAGQRRLAESAFAWVQANIE